MPKTAVGTLKAPEPIGRRRVSPRQEEILEALAWLREGKGTVVESDRGPYLVVALDNEKVGSLRQARIALANARWACHPSNARSSRRMSPEEYERVFGAAGRGGIRIEEQDGQLLMFVPAAYAEGGVRSTVKVATKATKAKAAVA